ncbi:hypothetical protein GCM10023340_13010 [Nocardioides marinquilinus]|uniref:Uncharacterized protein n=1 Tax=Nocardioides marinquilinus TaxID=1210400 RepID=A0ABP9PF80_9ACTN
MSNRRPPLPSGVYWRRRLFVLGTVAALVLLAVNLVRGGGDDAPADDAARLAGESATAPSATPSTAPTDAGRPGRGGQRPGPRAPRPTPTPTPTPEPEPPAEPSGPCEPRDVVVTPSAPVAVAGGPVTFRLLVGTLETPACYWTLERSSLALAISDAGQEVWSSSVCGKQLPSVDVVARRDQPATVDVVWDGRASLPDCRRGAPAVGPGDYSVRTAALGGEPSDPVTFTLIDPAVVPEEPEPEPDPEDDGAHAQSFWSLRD